jgi:DNA-binding XRE family transcriptional regulator
VAIPTTASFGELLRHHRAVAGLTQEALAERAGMSVYGIQKLERGLTHPYRDTARRLAFALGLSPMIWRTSSRLSCRCDDEAVRPWTTPTHQQENTICRSQPRASWDAHVNYRRSRLGSAAPDYSR